MESICITLTHRVNDNGTGHTFVEQTSPPQNILLASPVPPAQYASEAGIPHLTNQSDRRKMRVFVTSANTSILYEFSLRDRYAPGDPLGEAEAAALNRLMAENISRNRTATIRKLEAQEGDPILPCKSIKALQQHLEEYADNYKIIPVPSERRGDIEREGEQVKAERDCQQCSDVALCDTCLEEGRRRVLAKAGIAMRALADL